jgi:hypothetical protein
MIKFIKSIFKRVNVWPIVSDHLASFYDYNILTNQNRKVIPVTDLFLFLILPSLLAGALVGLFHISFDNDVINILITSLSIFLGLLLSLLVLVFDLGRKENEQLNNVEQDKVNLVNQLKAKIKLIREIFSHVLFTILLAGVAIICALGTQLIKLESEIAIPASKIFDCVTLAYSYASHFVSVFMIIEFIISLLMILKRFKILFEIEFKSMD